MTTTPPPAGADALALVAATGIPGTMHVPPPRPLPDEELGRLVAETGGTGRWGEGRGLSGLLLEAVTTGDGPQ